MLFLSLDLGRRIWLQRPWAQSLGFATCGSHIDDEDGLEIDNLRRFERWPPEWLAKARDNQPFAADRTGTAALVIREAVGAPPGS
jgi:hypothetical protein